MPTFGEETSDTDGENISLESQGFWLARTKRMWKQKSLLGLQSVLWYGNTKGKILNRTDAIIHRLMAQMERDQQTSEVNGSTGCKTHGTTGTWYGKVEVESRPETVRSTPTGFWSPFVAYPEAQWVASLVSKTLSHWRQPAHGLAIVPAGVMF